VPADGAPGVGQYTQGVRSASNSEASFKSAFNNCMRQRGHNVIN